MLNFQLAPLLTALDILRADFGGSLAATRDGNGQAVIPDNYKNLYKNHFEYAARLCAQLLLEKADARIMRMAPMLNWQLTYAEWGNQLRILLEAIEDDLKFERFYHYRRDRGLLVLTIPGDWSPAIKAFPSATPEIEDAVDCFALEHPTSAVFHLMRVAEYGLRALATERAIKLPKNKPLEWGTWSDLIKGIKDAADDIGRTKRAGPVKDEALGFYNGAVAHFDAFKDQYRNMVMHVRKRYEEAEAQKALTHVRDFMNGLSAKVGEATKRPIKWRF